MFSCGKTICICFRGHLDSSVRVANFWLLKRSIRHNVASSHQSPPTLLAEFHDFLRVLMEANRGNLAAQRPTDGIPFKAPPPPLPPPRCYYCRVVLHPSDLYCGTLQLIDFHRGVPYPRGGFWFPGLHAHLECALTAENRAGDLSYRRPMHSRYGPHWIGG